MLQFCAANRRIASADFSGVEQNWIGTKNGNIQIIQ
jgi:hypothetical protein